MGLKGDKMDNIGKAIEAVVGCVPWIIGIVIIQFAVIAFLVWRLVS